MNRARQRVFWLLASALAAGCSWPTQFAQTAAEPAAAVVDSGASPSPADAGCPADLAARLQVTHVDVDRDIRYKVPRYDGYPFDDRIALSIARDGHAYVAWTALAGGVQITPLDTQLVRSEPDISVDGSDIGGLIAHDQGFALLTRRDDPGETDADPTPPAEDPVTAAFLLRYAGRSQVFAAQLTGAASITADTEPRARDCATGSIQIARLAWNGVRYGMYFPAHACGAVPRMPAYVDKLVYADDRGRHVAGGWDSNCDLSLGVRLLPEPGAFTSVCLSDRLPFPGVNLVTEGVPARQLSAEYTAPSFAAASLGSLVKVPADGSYVLSWLSRGISTADGRVAAATPAYDIALLRLGPDYQLLVPKKWLQETPDVAELNLHMAAYGPDRLLLTWERIEAPRCTDRTCWGPYSGTRAQIIDLNGNPLSPETAIDAPPNVLEDIAVFPNGDLGWAFVADDQRNYEEPIDSRDVPGKHQLSIARLRVCE